MNQSTPQILIVEIKTIEGALFDTQQLEEMTIYQDPENQYYFSQGIERIKTAMLNSIPRLGSNYRYHLLFNVQIIRGNNIDAELASIDDLRGRTRGRRIR